MRTGRGAKAMRLETIEEKREREAREFFKRNALAMRQEFWQRKQVG